MAWVMRDEYPVACVATGGRQSRTGVEHGHVFDHFSAQFDYENGTRLFASCRHQKGCSNWFTVEAVGSQGRCDLQKFSITGANPWESGQRRTEMHQLEHDAMYAALRRGETINNGEYMAKSTMMAILARMSAYTGQRLTWDQALASQERLAPDAYSWDADPPPAEVAIPGITRFV
jgi:predicted dehydrogenase